MVDREIQAEVRSLLDDRIKAYEEIEIVLLLSRNLATWFTAVDIAGRLDLAEHSASQALHHPSANGLAEQRRHEQASRFRYRPTDRRLRRSVQLLEGEYRDNPVGIVRQISANAIERMRCSLLRAFANALFRRDGYDS